ncbi:MAG: hypothetical protein ACOC80_14215, partial [Petrotogales bacterium]
MVITEFLMVTWNWAFALDFRRPGTIQELSEGLGQYYRNTTTGTGKGARVQLLENKDYEYTKYYNQYTHYGTVCWVQIKIKHDSNDLQALMNKINANSNVIKFKPINPSYNQNTDTILFWLKNNQVIKKIDAEEPEPNKEKFTLQPIAVNYPKNNQEIKEIIQNLLVQSGASSYDVNITDVVRFGSSFNNPDYKLHYANEIYDYVAYPKITFEVTQGYKEQA